MIKLDDAELIEKTKKEFQKLNPTMVIKDAFITETTDHSPVVILRSDFRVLANYQVLDNNRLWRLDNT